MKELTRKVNVKGIKQYIVKIKGVRTLIYDYDYYINYKNYEMYIDLKHYYYNTEVQYDKLVKRYYIYVDNAFFDNENAEEKTKIYLDLSDVKYLLHKKVKPVVKKFDCKKLRLNYNTPGFAYLLQGLDKLGYTNYNDVGIKYENDTENSLEKGTFVFTSSYLKTKEYFNITVGRKYERLFIEFDNGKCCFTVTIRESTRLLDKKAVDDVLATAKQFIDINKNNLYCGDYYL